MISTQADRLQEIIVVDDASDPPLERFAKADEYKVRFIVHDAAVGLIGAKLTGGNQCGNQICGASVGLRPESPR